MKGWGWSLLVAVIIAMSFRSAVAELNVVPTGSMKPTIMEGDRIVVNKLAYDLKIPFTTTRVAVWDHPRRGDVVVFFSPADGTRLVKRVVGLPGDKISMKDNRLHINGEPSTYGALDPKRIAPIAAELGENRLFFTENHAGEAHPVMITIDARSRNSFGPVATPLDSYFMMGDNRDESADSRYFGFVRRDRIMGRAVGVAFSLDKEHFYYPRWSRFFSKLL
ncbi:MAG: signal peptidase I [Desulfobacterales bacterium]|nr:signal peptidase I [Desulfobacterales bacterium]